MKKIVAALASISLAAVGLTVFTQPANAADCTTSTTSLATQDGTSTNAGAASNPYLIQSTDDLQWLAWRATSTHPLNGSSGLLATAGVHFKQTQNLTFNGCTLKNFAVYPFQGHYDGDGKTISFLKVAPVSGFAGLFPRTFAASISNLKLDLAQSTSFQDAGVVVGDAFDTGFNNIEITNSVVTLTSNGEGGALAGQVNNGSILSNITVRGLTLTGEGRAGGIVGHLEDSSLTNALVIGSEIDSRASSGAGVGGAVGKISGLSTRTVSNIKVIDTDVFGMLYTGGVVGTHDAGSMNQLAFLGGIVASSNNAQDPNSNAVVGGVVGLADQGNNFSYDQLAFRGTVDAMYSSTIGQTGLVGFATGGATTVSITNSYARGLVKHNEFRLDGNPNPTWPSTPPAGLVSMFGGTLTISNSYSRMAFEYKTRPNDSLPAFPVYSSENPPTATLTSVYYDEDLHTDWVASDGSSPLETSEFSDAANYVGWSMTSDLAAVTAGTASEKWLRSSQLDQGRPVLTFEYLAGAIVPCPPGKYSITGIGTCTDVPAGNYTAFSGSFEPVLCPPGYSQFDPGQPDCDPASPGSFVPGYGNIVEFLCLPGEYQDLLAQTACKTVDPGFFTANAGSDSQIPCPAGMTSAAGANSCYAIPQYTGPIISEVNPSEIAPGDEVTVTGSRLDSIDEFEIAGLRAKADCNNTVCTFTAPEVEVSGEQDLIAFGSFGSLRVQGAVSTSLGTGIEIEGLRIWTKKISDTEVKFYAKNIVGAGKVQFFVNGREIAWVRAENVSNPKLRETKGFYYLVRTVTLSPGKKTVLEGYLNGERLRRSAYTAQ